MTATIGVYIIKCKANGRRYIGSSVRSAENRLSWHWTKLRAGQHNSEMLADFQTYGRAGFDIQVKACSDPRAEETRLLKYWATRCELYNKHPSSDGTGFKFSSESRQLMSERAVWRNHNFPGYNKMISERAKQQHVEGKLGRATWKGPANMPKGEESSNAKLTEKDVLAIRAEPRTYGYQVRLANKYGVTQVCISRVVLRKCWKHI